MSFEIINRLKLDCDLIDLRTISPWDRKLVFAEDKTLPQIPEIEKAIVDLIAY